MLPAGSSENLGIGMGTGSRELARGASTYLACLAFILAFLVTTVTGGTGLTAVFRGAAAAVSALVLGGLLMRPLISTVLDAMARDTADKQAEDA